MAIRHELSWSTTRESCWQACPRRYYYDYYLSWGGWLARADEERRRVWQLKKMTRMPMLAGDVLHRALASWFADRVRGIERGPDSVLEEALGALRAAYRESRDGGGRGRPGKATRLAEHHYGEAVVDEQSGRASAYGGRYVERLRAAVARFFEEPRLAGARAAEPATWLACEEMGSFELDGVKVFAVPDFSYEDAEGRVWILDWKSGEPRPEDRLQLGVYALYAEARWGIAPERVVGADVYLAAGDWQESRFDAAGLDELRRSIRGSLAVLRELHFDAEAGRGDPAAFPLVEAGSEAARACTTCNYRELCARA